MQREGTPLPPPVVKHYTRPTNTSVRPLQGTDRLVRSDQFAQWLRQSTAVIKSCGGDTWKVALGAARPPNLAEDAGTDPISTCEIQQHIWDDCNEMGLNLLTLSVDPSVNYLLDGVETSYGALAAVRQHFQPNDGAGIMATLTSLFGNSHLTTTSLAGVNAWEKDYKEKKARLDAVQMGLSDAQTSAHLITLLPGAFNTVRVSLQLEAAGEITKLKSPEEIFNFIRGQAKQDSSIASGNTAVVPTQAFVAASRKGDKKKRVGKPPSLCYVPGCGQLHWVQDCTHPNKAAFEADRQKRTTIARAAIASPSTPIVGQLSTILGEDYPGLVHGWKSNTVRTLSPSPLEDYNLDTGANMPMTSRRDHFFEFVECQEESVSGITGNLVATGVGKIAFLATLPDGSKSKIIVNNCLYVPSIAANLISISSLGKKGYKATFGLTGVITSQDGSVVATARLAANSLYVLNAEVVIPARASAALASSKSSSMASLTTWHRRLAHISPQTIKRMANDSNIIGLSLSPGSQDCVCNACLVGKATRLPFPSSPTVYKKKLEVAEADILEVNHASLAGRHYVFSIADKFSHKVWAYPIGRKSESFDTFRTWLAEVETESGCKLQALRMDNAGELSNAWRSFLSERGIKLQLTQPYTSQQNGGAERTNLTETDGIITLLEDSGLARKYWAEALLHFVYTKNRTPHRGANGRIPDCIWHNKPVLVNHLRPFGCEGWMTIISKQEKRRKLDAKGRRVVMLGYDPQHKAYRVLDPDTNKIHISRDVRFLESSFPYNKSWTTKCGGQLNSAPPLVRPGVGNSDDAEDVLTFSSTDGWVYPHSTVTPSSIAPGSPSVPISPNGFEELEVQDGKDDDSSDDDVPRPRPPATIPSAPKSTRIQHIRNLVKPTPLVLPQATPLASGSGTRQAQARPLSPSPFVDTASPTASDESDDLDQAVRDRSYSPDPIDMLAANSSIALMAAAEKMGGNIGIALAAAAAQMLDDEDGSFNLPSSDPKTFKEAMLDRAKKANWWRAYLKEVQTLEMLHCYDKILEKDLPKGAKLIGAKPVFRTKRNKRGVITSFKCRIVAKGFTQREGIDFKETFAPVAKFTSIRTLIALAAKHGYEIQQADVDSAYIQGELPKDEIIYVRLPDGMEDIPGYAGHYLRLRKSLYGLKQSGRVWNIKINSTLIGLGYTRTRTDACVYTKLLDNGKRTYIALYVDDLLFVGPNMPEIQRVKDDLHIKFGIKDMGAAEFILGIQIQRVPSGIWMGQKAYLQDVVDRFRCSDCTPLSTPMEPGLSLRNSDGEINSARKTLYLQAIGSLMYAMLGTRPDLAHAVGYLSRFSNNPGVEHWNAVLHVIRYIKGTLDYGLFYSSSPANVNGFMAYTDSDWGACVETSRSTMGYAFILSGAAISWSSHLQSRVASSSTDAEYIGIGNAGKECIHLDQQLGELGEGLAGPIILYGDNQGAIALTKEARFHERTKHIRLAEHFAREMVERGEVRVEYIPTGDMVADIMTKSLPRPAFEKFRLSLGVVPMPA